MNEIQSGDLIQITNRNHPWFPAILFVTGVHASGILAGCIIPRAKGTAATYNLFRFEDVKKVGRVAEPPALLPVHQNI